MSRRLGVLLALGGIALAIVGVLFVGLVLRQATAPAAQATHVPAVTIPVVVTTHALPVRALLAASDVAVVQMPVEFAPLQAVSDAKEVVGFITEIPMVAGELLMRDHLADPTNISSQNLGFVIGQDQVVMAFPANDLMSQVDVLKPGDLVDILVSVPEPVVPAGQVAASTSSQAGNPNMQLFTFNALQRLTIQAIVVNISKSANTASNSSLPAVNGTPAPTATPSVDEIHAQAILLALAPQDALVLKHLKDAGGVFDIVLRAPTASQNFDLHPVMDGYLIDRYQLVIQH
jgi:pilus assembly protein CpaB